MQKKILLPVRFMQGCSKINDALLNASPVVISLVVDFSLHNSFSFCIFIFLKSFLQEG